MRWNFPRPVLMAGALALALTVLAPASRTQPPAVAACPPEVLASGHCAPGAGAIGAIVAAAGQAANANRTRVAAACVPISAGNAGSLLQAGNTNVGFGQRLKWAPGSDAFYTLGQTEVDRYAVATLQKTVLQSGAAQVVDFSAASGLVALTSNHLSVQLRDLNTQTDKGTITPSGQFGAASLSPDGSLIAFGLLSAIAEEVRSTANGALVATFTGFSTGSPVYSASFAPDGQSLIWLARARVQQMALAGGAFGPPFEHEDFVLDISIADNKLATAFGEGDRVWNLTTGAKLFDVRPADGGFAAVLTADGGLLFVGNKSQIGVYDTATALPIVTYGLPGSSLALAPNGCLLLSASADGALTVLRASSTALPFQPGGPLIRAPSTGDGGLVGLAADPQ
jgi:hypothetical protein